MGKVQLERALSKLGVASRSQTREWIEQGKISVDGKVIKDPGFLVVPETARILVNGKKVVRAAHCLIMLNKPKGYVTTKSDERGRKTVFDLLPTEYRHVHPVGRLDMNTTGLLLLTTDTQLSSQLTDPDNAIERVYLVSVKGKITEQLSQQLIEGIKDEDEILSARKIHLRKISNRESHLIVTLIEGKNREIRRMFKAVGHEVTALKRVSFGQWSLGDLASGAYKILEQS